jgi:hypothetical protein
VFAVVVFRIMLAMIRRKLDSLYKKLNHYKTPVALPHLRSSLSE